MVYVKLSSAHIQLTQSIISLDRDVHIADLKHRISNLFPPDVEPVTNADNDIKIIFFGRVINNDEILGDVLLATPSYPASHIFTFHFSVLQSTREVPAPNLLDVDTDNNVQQQEEPPAYEATDSISEVASPSPPHYADSTPAELPFTYALSNGNNYTHGIHSYDSVQSSSGSSYLVDQLEIASTVYEITITDLNGDDRTIQIPSSQCIINDTGDHQPYILLTKTAVSLIHNLLGVRLESFQVNIIEPTSNTDYRGFNHHFRHSRVNRWYSWRRPIRDSNGLFDGIRVFGYDFHNISWTELPFFLYDNCIRSIEHFLITILLLARSGGLSRLFFYMLGLVKFMAVLLIFDIRYELQKKHPYIYYSIAIVCFLLTLFDEHNANNLREILNRDLSNIAGRSTILHVLQRIREIKTQLNGIYNTANNEVVSLVIGNNRTGLVINDYGNTYQQGIMGLVAPNYHQSPLIRYATIFIQDILCFFITLIPRFYIVFNHEMIRRVSKVEQELIERASEVSAIAAQGAEDEEATNDVNEE